MVPRETRPNNAGEAKLPGLDHFRFLIVDDDDFQRDALVLLLTNLGAVYVEQAGDGQEAIEQLQSNLRCPDIVLCDLNMPRMDGMACLRRMGELGIKTSVILLSSLGSALMESVETMGKAYGMDMLGTLPKPVSRSRLATLIAKHANIKLVAGSFNTLLIPQQELAAALEHGQFVPYFQPKVSMATGQVVGVEALARWRSPTRGLLSPGAFLDSVETYGLMDLLTWTILAQSARSAAAWQAHGRPLKVSVNLSLSSLGRIELAERIHEIVIKHGLAPTNMILEVTETAAMSDVARCLENLARLRMFGFGLSIDDYGTGYSSMQQLTRVPFTELKIDQSFVGGMVERESIRTIVESSLALASKLGISVTAEGIETIEQWQILKELSCPIGQGYLIGRPMAGESIPDWVSQWQLSDARQFVTSKRQAVNVLLVEDDDFQRETYGELIEAMAMGVVHTASGVEEALQRLASCRYDLVVTDFELGGLTGMHLLKLIRTGQTQASTATRVIMLSTHTEQELVLRSISLDLNGFITKPTASHALKAAIRMAMNEVFVPLSTAEYHVNSR